MSEVTSILEAIDQGDPQAASQLLPLVYDELRRLAAQKLTQEKPGQTLEATALVHEAYVRMLGGEGAESSRWANRRHFFAAAAESMRRSLVDNARHKPPRSMAATVNGFPSTKTWSSTMKRRASFSPCMNHFRSWSNTMRQPLSS